MPGTPPPPPFRRSIAVVIGIDQYTTGIPSLRTAVNDARRVGELLAGQHGYDVIAVVDAEATRARLVALLQDELPAAVGPDDRVCFYFAGHGVAVDGDQGPNGYLLPADANRADAATFLHMPLVHDALVALPCRHMLVILDSCFSGAFRWSGTRAFTPLPEVIHQERYDRFVHDPAWQVLTSASQDQEALDRLTTGALGSRDGEGDHSPFALALFEALEGQGDVVPRSGGDGVITATELYHYIEDRLQPARIEARKRQTPCLWQLPKHEKGEFIFQAPGRDVSLPKAPPLTFDANPWKGLAAYDKEDAALFFGRDAAIEALQAAIEAKPFVAVLGSSGTGKSSLVKAGVLPRLERDGRWRILPVVRPGSSPLDSIAHAVGTLAPAPVAGTPEAIAAAVTAWCAASPDTRLLLVVDQCEELVTMARAASARDTVTALLAAILDRCPRQVTVVLTLRTDFEPQFDRSALAPRWKDGRFVVPPMSRADLKAVIEQPASAKVLYFDPPALVETLLDDVVNTPGGLPLLSFALSEMYVRYVTRRATDRALTRDDYDALGGVVGALRSRADAEYDALDQPHRESMQRLMLRMVSGGAGSLVKRRVSDAELEYRDPAETTRVDEVKKRLTAARLVVEGKETDGESYAEPAHDALVRSWARLIGWMHEVNAEPVPLATRQKLATAALDWSRAADAAARKGLLWADSVRSAMLAPLLKGGHAAPWLNARERAFAERSVRGRRNARYASIAVTIAIAVLAVASLIFASQARTAAQDAAAEAERAEFEKERAVRSLFSSLKLYMTSGWMGSVCAYGLCQNAPPGDGDDDAWFSIAQLPQTVENTSDLGYNESRDFIAAREYGLGHVLVYAHDGLVSDAEIPRENAGTGQGADNLVFAENALRWLDAVGPPTTCAAGTTIVYWEGTYTRQDDIQAVQAFIARRGWHFVVTRPDTLDQDLACASVLWYSSDWTPPPDFATHHVPLVEAFVKDGGGLLVGGLGWSYWQENPSAPSYAADELGKPFGFRFTRDAFVGDKDRPLPVLPPEAGPGTTAAATTR
ncbi:MAG: caspase family protein [Vicinamibacterales bacterium]